jgi:transcriptional regulator with XRE-family HTH domain
MLDAKIAVKQMNLNDTRFLRDLGFRLREIRIKHGLTQEELGRQCQLHRTFVGSVERGERNLSILNLRTLAKALRVSLAELFDHAP